MIDIVQAKMELRQRMHALRDALPPDFQAMAAERLAHAASRPDFRRWLPEAGGVIGGYWPIRSEIDPRALMHRLAMEGFCLALPRIGDVGLVFHAYKMGDMLVKGPFGTQEPPAGSPIVQPDAILAPLLAFDAQGTRLGYGKSFYDRTFSAFPQARRIGLAFAVQEVAAVPHEAHDAALDAIFTEA